MIAGGSKANEVRMVDAETGAPIGMYQGLETAVSSICLLPEDVGAEESAMLRRPSSFSVVCENSAYILTNAVEGDRSGKLAW